MSTRLCRMVLVVLAAIVSIAFCSPAMAERITVGGTGAAMAFLRQIGQAFTAQTGIDVEVLPGIGSGGALRALGDGVLDIAVSGRPLNAEEKTRGLSVAFSLRTPFMLATSQPKPQRMSLAELLEAFDPGTKVWPDGEPIRVILRPRQESDTALMAESFPGLAAAMAAARRRPDVPIAATDQDHATLAEDTPGSLVGITYLQAVMERRKLTFVTIDDVAPTLENFEKGIYPHAKTLAFVTSARLKPAVDRFLGFVRSDEGETIFRHAHTH